MYDKRHVYRCFHIDANRINANGRLGFMNQLEKWHSAGVIRIQMASSAKAEASWGSAARARKTSQYIFTETAADTSEESELLERIERILFPPGARTVSERNDVDIVFNAHKYGCILVTNDGDSRGQPGGILGNRDRLQALGIQVLTDEEAVALVRRLIQKRDAHERQRSELTGEPLPSWVGSD